MTAPTTTTATQTPLRIVPRGKIIVGDALTQLRTLPSGSVDMVLTSPPYFRLRDYDTPGQLGLEVHVNAWVDQLQEVAAEVRRVLVPTGTFWLNVADTYSTHVAQGANRKSLLLGPERLALALVEDGWRLRNKIVWQKANPMPHSVRDRLTATWEALYIFAASDRYFFDLEALRLPHRTPPSKTRPAGSAQAIRTKREQWRGPNTDDASGLARLHAQGRVGHPLGKNPGDVWTIPASNYRGSHHATFPVALAEMATRAGCPEARCSGCRRPYVRDVVREEMGGHLTAHRGPLHPTCECGSASEPGLVLDPFMGAGTTALGAIENGRDWAGIELSKHFAEEARARIAAYVPVRDRQRTHSARAGP
ncbi:MAG: site-specific DNA-methyltransferase [Tetrasphaera sp.]